MLNEEGLSALGGWLQAIASHNKWQASVVAGRLAVIREGGSVTNEENEDLLVRVQRIISRHGSSTWSAFESPAQAWKDSLDFLQVAGSSFCLAG